MSAATCFEIMTCGLCEQHVYSVHVMPVKSVCCVLGYDICVV